MIIGHRNHQHEHFVVRGLVDTVHAAMRDVQVSLLKDGQLVYRLVDEYILRNPAHFFWSELWPVDSTTVMFLSPERCTPPGKTA